ncbi:MAG: polynucleotide adenylyltransferase PcnB [Gammaproteobacteria bacterium]|nr:polynucleotide adenylyltransferase PcnB [Gammaproteobacteria bacterium]MDE2263763.1 polynucleotide adenylyltransferase PcnB [Gammaproteobacteria bacterium]
MNSPQGRLVAPAAKPRVIPRAEHTISRSHISPNALRVLYRLKDAGFQGFLVGGCVRDLLLGMEPKDFDVATDALPDQVKRLFRNCRLVGRRFRLAHVFFGQEIIEVATFRAASAPSQGEEPLADADPEDGEAAELDEPELATESSGEAEDRDEAQDEASEPAVATRDRAFGREGRPLLDDDSERKFDETGRILRDNVYGTIDEDVWRRDFTANSLYYNIADFSIWDYVGGVEDIAARRLRLIGDPETRFREDPVRMLRAARFEAKLGFEIDPQTAEPIGPLRELLGGVPPARLFDETLKLFLTGHGAKSLEALRRRGLLAQLLPSVDSYLTQHSGGLVERLLMKGLANTDARAAAGRPLTPTFLLALLLYGPIAQIIESMPPEKWHEISAIVEACDRAVRQAQAHLAIPRRFSLGLSEMFSLQPRFEHPSGRRSLRLLTHPRFRAAYDLLLLRAELGLASPEMARWWTQVQEVPHEEQGRMADALAQAAGPRPGRPRPGGRRRRRGRRGPRAS